MLRFLKKKKSDPKEIIREVFGDTELPSFPTMVMEVLGLLRNPDVTMGEVAAHLERDPGLSIKVLRTVNSAAFGLTTRVNHVGHAASLLGRSRLESIVLSVAVNVSMPLTEVKGFDQGKFWFTAAKRGCLARLLAHRLHPSTEVEAFTAGLLQDMGIPLLVTRKKEAYVDVYKQWQNDPGAILEELEYDAFGFDHTEVGSVVAEVWELPAYLVEAISGHHSWDDGNAVEQAVQLVSLLRDSEVDDGTSRMLEIGASDFDTSEDVMSELIAEAFEVASEYRAIFE